jgi:hypothetical protein
MIIGYLPFSHLTLLVGQQLIREAEYYNFLLSVWNFIGIQVQNTKKKVHYFHDLSYAHALTYNSIKG